MKCFLKSYLSIQFVKVRQFYSNLTLLQTTFFILAKVTKIGYYILNVNNIPSVWHEIIFIWYAGKMTQEYPNVGPTNVQASEQPKHYITNLISVLLMVRKVLK